MKRIVKRVVCLGLALCSSLFLSVPAFATTAKTKPDKPVLFTITVNSEEEKENVIAELEAHNKKAQELWEKAVKESNLNTQTSAVLPSAAIAASSMAKSNAETSARFNGQWVHINAYVTYNKVKVKNYNTFGKVYGFNMYGRDSTTSISDIVYNYKTLDSERTLALSSTCLVGVKNYTGDFQYYDYQAYIEFYTNGKGNFY
ncbi:hypothetical protein [Faecalispora jeddahensis]|uniref:hypothetical protein n=1 Tax=Faecalispora jeddahensis TaxID=1414721 RepID=UPI0027BA7478|nr:hypothetical protein [Faecalispora jeddahensis]